MTPLESILMTGIGALAGVIALLWKAFFSPMMTKMLTLIDTLNVEQPKQTKAIEEQTPILRELASTAVATKHATAEHLKNQVEDREKLAEVHETIVKGACRFVPHQGAP